MPPIPATQVALLDEDLEPEAEAEFEAASQKITITFTPYENSKETKPRNNLEINRSHSSTGGR